MFASDSTMLAAFGTAKLWPLYMFYGNDSKYKRAKPTEKLFETVAYFEKVSSSPHSLHSQLNPPRQLPDSFKDFLIKLSGKSTINPALLTHCQREFFHEQWRCLLDDEFVHAYCHGIVVKCYDGKDRRFFPRILTYSADYPEKILLASIKNLRLFPCPRCYVAMVDVPSMGKKRDRTNRTRLARVDDEAKRTRVSKARALVYRDHNPVTSTLIEGHLAYGSLIPTNVCPKVSPVLLRAEHLNRMRSPRGSRVMGSTCTTCLWWMSCTRLKLAHGKQCSSNCCA